MKKIYGANGSIIANSTYSVDALLPPLPPLEPINKPESLEHPDTKQHVQLILINASLLVDDQVLLLSEIMCGGLLIGFSV